MTHPVDPARRGALRVGVIGCGAVVQAIHVPVLARLTELWQVVHVADVDAAAAAWVGRLTGARVSTDGKAVIDDPEVQVVLVCSPHVHHAEHVIAACRAGKLAVLCEKPMCSNAQEAAAIAAASMESGVPVLTATMHLFDPAFAAAVAQWPADLVPDFVESECFLPPNSTFADLASQLVFGSRSQAPPNAEPSAQFARIILGLASHHIPLVRRLAPGPFEVRVATVTEPGGYNVTLKSPRTLVRMLAVVPSETFSWQLHAHSEEACLRASFPPSYLQAGSSRAELTLAGEPMRTWQFSESGYVQEWRLLYQIATGAEDSQNWVDAALGDLLLAEQIIAGFEEPRA